MTIRINKISNQIISTYRIKKYARRKILTYNIGADELLLSKYLLKNYKINLKYACLIILNNCTFYNTNDTTIIKILRPDLDKLATLITYGNEQVAGSKILLNAFK